MARGRSRSDTIDGVLANAHRLAAEGAREIVLTGINLGDFGRGPDGRAADGLTRAESFAELIEALDDVPGIDRYRISSIEPNLLTDDIIRFVARSRKFMPHFHIPLQSGSNRILGLMRRRYRRELYAERVDLIKSLMPHCAIGVDVIAGFPSETDTDFRETFDFLHALDVTYLHVFTYSERADTHALTLSPVVPMGLRHERNKTLRNLSFMKTQAFTRANEGQTRPVLFERLAHAASAAATPSSAADGAASTASAMMEGYTDNYIKVTTPYRAEWANQIVDWRL